MAKLDDYRQCVRQLLQDYARRGSCEDGVEAQTIFDSQCDRYQLIYVGWHDRRRVYGPVLHFDIKNEKIWIQLNGTEDDVAAALMEMGVSRSDIVLGFQAPHRRQFTEFAVS